MTLTNKENRLRADSTEHFLLTMKYVRTSWENFSIAIFGNLFPRVSPLHAPGSERGETLVGAGHVSPKEKLDPGRGPSPACLCQDLLSTPKRGLHFVARSPRKTRSTGYVFQ